MTVAVSSLIEARELLRRVERDWPEASDVQKSLEAAILGIEIAWSLIEEADEHP